MTPISRIATTLLLIASTLQPGHTQVTAAQTPGSTPPPAAPAGCTSAESHQLDFWVGHWNVSPKAAPQHKVATSRIEKLYSGCAVRENWMPLRGGDGGSFSSYLPDKHGWQQLWVDSSGSWVTFTGGWDGHAMVLEGVLAPARSSATKDTHVLSSAARRIGGAERRYLRRQRKDLAARL